jgi:hypothetical protein
LTHFARIPYYLPNSPVVANLDGFFEPMEIAMEGITSANTQSVVPSETLAVPAPTNYWRHAFYLTVLVVLAASIRFWLMGHTAVAARDSIGYIRYALKLESEPWTQVIRSSEQHPGYPAALLLASWPVRHWMGGTNADSMQVSAQLATIIAALLLVLPLYFLGCELFNPRIAFWGTALFQCLPATARSTADGLSEGVYFLFAVTAIWLAARALRTNSLTCFVFSGLATGLAYMTRPEGALILIASGFVLLALQFVTSLRRSWPRVVVSGACLVLAALVAGSPYFLVVGKFTNKPTPEQVIKGKQTSRSPNGDLVFNQPPSSQPVVSSSAGSMAPLFAIYLAPGSKNRNSEAIKAVCTEIIQAYQYLLGIALLVGLWVFRKTLALLPGAWILATMFVLQFVILWRMAIVMGYVSERHVVMLILCGLFTVAATLDWLGTRLANSRINFLHAKWLAFAPLVVLTFCWLPSTLKTLHANRAGHKVAGTWIASHAAPEDDLIDPFCWAHYYAGRVFLEDQPAPAHEPGHKKTKYAVLEHPDKEHPRLPLIPAANELANKGKLVYSWPEKKPSVFVFALEQGE